MQINKDQLYKVTCLSERIGNLNSLIKQHQHCSDSVSLSIDHDCGYHEGEFTVSKAVLVEFLKKEKEKTLVELQELGFSYRE